MIPEYIQIAVGLLTLVLLYFMWQRLRQPAGSDLDKAVREEFRQEREEADRRARALREELAATQNRSNELLVKMMTALGDTQKQNLEHIARATKEGEAAVQKLIVTIREELARQREQVRDLLLNIQKENEARFERVRLTLDERLKGIAAEQQKHMADIVKAQREEQEKARDMLERKFRLIQESNEKKLEEMRKTVDEKLHDTLEKRLGESFKLVSERLEAVQRGLGEMQHLANGVGDLKRVLVNVKERGTWGEYQLGGILADILTPEQYAQNVATKDGRETVEFAVKLPGRTGDHAQPVWLPIDSKFPKESYER
ncbi:MAG TPA: DNA recombination protein RmuC, partial [Candidatus Hydrogenedentes bacterium]|nr:DNA recombination protein RmuC [Candidatus Hydrogenedentota bacterium]